MFSHRKIVKLAFIFWLSGLFVLSAADQKRPIVIAHRGGAALRPENTIAAFQHALKLGVPVLEFDMNVIADGQIVIHHDSAVSSSVCAAPRGSDVQPGPIGLLTLAKLKLFDCGSFARPKSPHYRPVPGQKMPTLDEFLMAVKNSDALLLGETKMQPEGSAYAPDPEGFVDLIDASLRKHQVEHRFILQSADYRTIDAMRKKNPEVQRCLLSARRFKPDYLPLARKHYATHLMLRFDDVTSEDLLKLRSSGLKIFSGTANSTAEWKKYVEMNVDGILTDDPQGLIQFLEKNVP